MKILLVRKLGRNSLSPKLNISLRPFDLLCTSAEKLGFFPLLSAFFLLFLIEFVLTYKALKNSLVAQVPQGCERKRLHGFNPGLKLNWALNVIISCWIHSFPKYFWKKTKSGMLRGGERRNILLSRS